MVGMPLIGNFATMASTVSAIVGWLGDRELLKSMVESQVLKQDQVEAFQIVSITYRKPNPTTS
jgi:hypothetical protein